jgi:hypothetical protein
VFGIICLKARNLSVFQKFQANFKAHSHLFNSYRSSRSGVKRLGYEGNHHFHPVQRIRMSGVIPPFLLYSYMSLRCGRGKLPFFICVKDWLIFNFVISDRFFDHVWFFVLSKVRSSESFVYEITKLQHSDEILTLKCPDLRIAEETNILTIIESLLASRINVLR